MIVWSLTSRSHNSLIISDFIQKSVESSSSIPLIKSNKSFIFTRRSPIAAMQINVLSTTFWITYMKFLSGLYYSLCINFELRKIFRFSLLCHPFHETNAALPGTNFPPNESHTSQERCFKAEQFISIICSKTHSSANPWGLVTFSWLFADLKFQIMQSDKIIRVFIRVKVSIPSVWIKTKLICQTCIFCVQLEIA